MSAAQSAPGPTALCSPVRVRVFHNNDFGDACFVGYQVRHCVTEVFTYTTARTTAADDDTVLLEAVYHLLNVGDDPDVGPPDPRAQEYRRRRNRSLSVGDIVAVNDRFYACGSSGWEALQHAPRIDQRTMHGTTPLYEAAAESAAAPARRRTIRELSSVLCAVAAAGWAHLARVRRSLLLSRRPRPAATDLYFVAETAESLLAVGEELRNRGFLVSEEPTDLGDQWSLVAVAPDEVTEQTCHLLADVAARHNATFDGTGQAV